MTVKNAQLRRRYFGKHFEDGVAQYRDPSENDGKPYCILVRKNAIDRMNPTFECRPVFVHHVNDSGDADDKGEAVGTVVKSFYNELDGAYWVEFIVDGDRGHEAIARGWRLSNAYRVTEHAGGGEWHAVPYVQDVMNGEFDHLAIVDKPRYESSIILTPEDFKTYNEKLKADKNLRVNSKGDSMKLPKFFNRTEVPADKIKELCALTLMLEKSGRSVAVLDVLNEADEAAVEKKKNEDAAAAGEFPMCNAEHMIEVEEAGEKKKYNAATLAAKYNELHKTAGEKEETEESEEAKNKKNAEAAEKESKELETKKNALAADEAKVEAAKADLAEKTRLFNERKNAIDTHTTDHVAAPKIVTIADHLALGRQLY